MNTMYSQLSPCGHFPITDTLIMRTAAESPAKINYSRLTEINSCYYGLSYLLRTLTCGPEGVRNKGSWLCEVDTGKGPEDFCSRQVSLYLCLLWHILRLLLSQYRCHWCGYFVSKLIKNVSWVWMCLHLYVFSFLFLSSFAKETKFEYEVHQNIQEERQNQLRW